MRHHPNDYNGDLTQIRLEVLTWLANGDVSDASKHIALRMANIKMNGNATPIDPTDFKKCMDMLTACPSIRDLSRLSYLVPYYAPYVDNWNEMVSLYETDVNDCFSEPKLNEFMGKREKESAFIVGKIFFKGDYIPIDQFVFLTKLYPTLEDLHDMEALGVKSINQRRDKLLLQEKAFI